LISPALYSSKSEDWATPRKLAAELVAEFGITHDVCATPENAVVPSFWTKEGDALSKQWKGVCYMNPPYGRRIWEWLSKAVMSTSTLFGVPGTVVVCLLPARTDTRWWHKYVAPHASEIRFLKGRLHFNGSKNSAPFPSVVVVFGKVKS
jgi:phage N-6-adenine-methyltransferase